MYIQKITIKNIRSIREFEMTFKQSAGWHVLIGDNGAGKSTFIKSVALALLDYNDISALREDWNTWPYKEFDSDHNLILMGHSIKLELVQDTKYEILKGKGYPIKNEITFLSGYDQFNTYVSLIDKVIHRNLEVFQLMYRSGSGSGTGTGPSPTPTPTPTKKIDAWFSVAYGPFRRFGKGDAEKEQSIEKSNPRLSAHLSAFGEDVALSEAIPFIQNLHYKHLDKKEEGEYFTLLIRFINENALLNNAKISHVDSTGLYIKDWNGQIVPAQQMSDGYRSVLSLTIEFIRQLIRVYGYKEVFKNSEANDFIITLPGVVLIDEIDAHLHPTWQTRIGQWFTKYFPNIQFIVTTHSPLVCRAAEKGSIWQLPATGTDEVIHEITGYEKNRLVYGNVLDQYGTGAFGERTSISEEGRRLLEELSELNTKFSFGKTTAEEEIKMKELRRIFTTENTIDETSDY